MRTYLATYLEEQDVKMLAESILQQLRPYLGLPAATQNSSAPDPGASPATPPPAAVRPAPAGGAAAGGEPPRKKRGWPKGKPRKPRMETKDSPEPVAYPAPAAAVMEPRQPYPADEEFVEEEEDMPIDDSEI